MVWSKNKLEYQYIIKKRKEWTIDTDNNLDKSENYAKWEKSTSKFYVLNDSI